MKNRYRKTTIASTNERFSENLSTLGIMANIKNCQLIRVLPDRHRMAFSPQATAMLYASFDCYGVSNEHSHFQDLLELKLPLIDSTEVVITDSAHDGFLSGGVDPFLYVLVATFARCHRLTRRSNSAAANSENSLFSFNQRIDDNHIAVAAKVISVPGAKLPIVRTFIYWPKVEHLSQL
jgi:hypothetical protein